jgi:hypothetical protein
MIGQRSLTCHLERSAAMPRKSVYFPDEQWPLIERAAELEDRSVSKWLQRSVDRTLTDKASVADWLAGLDRWPSRARLVQMVREFEASR